MRVPMRKRQHRVFYLSRCAVCIALGSTFTHVAWARDYFNPAFIENHGQANRTSVDLSTFDNDKSQLPGTYYVTININKTEIGARNVDFQLATLSDGQQALQGCLRLQELKDNGVKTDLFPTLESEKGCVDLSVIPGASQRFDFQQQALSVSIPQLYIANNARGYVPPEKWQEGITALMLNYSFSGYKEYGSSEDSDDAESKYLALQPGFNLGPWRFRNYSNWSSNNGESGSWNSVYNYLQRDIIALKSQFTAGDSNTPSDVFDSVPFRGLQLTSDDQMQPNSQRGYAPTIRGIARSNAQVIVRQNGYIAYQTAVSPGEFEINDMFPTGSNGDYDVTVKETGTYSEAGSNGQQMDFYVLVAGKLEIGTETYIVGNLKQYIPVPFSAISNQDPTAGGCTGADINKMSAGNKGNVRIYITHPLVGEITIPETTIMNLYLSKTPGSSGDNIPPSVPPMAHVTMSGTITVPQSCSINAGQVIEVRLPDIEGKDIRHLGDSPQNSHVTTQVNFTCSNVADGTNLSMSLNGATDPHNPDYLKTDNENLGIRISDKYDNTIVPGGSA